MRTVFHGEYLNLHIDREKTIRGKPAMVNSVDKKNAFVPIKDVAVTVMRKILVMIGGTILIGLGAHLDIPMIPVPMSMQTYAVVVIGALAGWRLGGLTLVMYLTAAAAGAPLFSGGASGIDHLIGPTAGYLAGFVVSAVVVGYLAENGWTRAGFWHSTLAMLVGHAITLGLGTLWLAGEMGFASALEAGMTPFLLGALAKSLLAAMTIHGLMVLWSKKSNLEPS
jgi:biotin transport system substrate-specific component